MKILQAITDDGPLVSRGITQPHKMEADDHLTYVVKFTSNVEPNSNCNEFLGSSLAKHVSIPVLEPCRIRLDAEFIDRSPYLSSERIRPGTYFATPFIEEGYPLYSVNDDMVITNLDKVPQFIAYDVFIHNEDRNRGNTMAVPNGPSNNAKYHYVLIDHGRCFRLVGKKLPYASNTIYWNMSEVTPERLKYYTDQLVTLVTPTALKSIFEKNDNGNMCDGDYVGRLVTALADRDAGKIMDAMKSNDSIPIGRRI